jgi:hypothetical protein
MLKVLSTTLFPFFLGLMVAMLLLVQTAYYYASMRGENAMEETPRCMAGKTLYLHHFA